MKMTENQAQAFDLEEYSSFIPSVGGITIGMFLKSDVRYDIQDVSEEGQEEE